MIITGKIFSFDAGFTVTRESLGLPFLWSKIEKTLNDSKPKTIETTEKAQTFKMKCPEVEKLDDYGKTPNEKFWKSFPENVDLNCFHTPVKTEILEKMIKKCEKKWTIHEKKIAYKTLKDLKTGTTSKFKASPVPCENVTNGRSSIFFGQLITDSVASWVKKKFILGPFKNKPFEDICISPMIASKQKNKVRPILNLSAPEAKSVNDYMKKHLFRKLIMSSAKQFGQSLLKAGKNAVFSKTDIQDAYKMLPCHKNERRCFAFKWLDRYFIDISTPFGSKAAPSNFDDLAETIVNITKTISGTKKEWIHRQLDDVPVISPIGSGITEKFTKTYKTICKELNVPLAENCKKFEKAFDETTQGTVLGIEFDSKKLTWQLPIEKFEETIQILQQFRRKKTCTLIDFQKLHGKLNDFGQMNTFSKGFKFNQNAFLKQFETEKTWQLHIPENLRKELDIWEKMIIEAMNGQKIPEIIKSTPFICEKFISDAAGPKITWSLQHGHNVNLELDSGFACIGYRENDIHFACVNTWPIKMLQNFPSSSAILECIGLIAPFIVNPKMLVGKNILLQVDNSTCVFAWEKRVPKSNETLAILIQTLHIFEAALPCRIFIEHVKRNSNEWAILVDKCSRRSSIRAIDLKKIEGKTSKMDGPLVEWFEDPVNDWNLPLKIVKNAILKI